MNLIANVTETRFLKIITDKLITGLVSFILFKINSWKYKAVTRLVIMIVLICQSKMAQMNGRIRTFRNPEFHKKNEKNGQRVKIKLFRTLN